MTAAETIAAAIEKLELARERSTPGEWRVVPLAKRNDIRTDVGYDVRGDAVATAADSGFGAVKRFDAELIVTLHRTIDAQLEILQDAQLAWADPLPMPVFGGGDMREGIYAFHLNLARAILGEDA